MKIKNHDKYEVIHESVKRFNTFLSEPNGYFCIKCGNELKTSYLEERLYCVECSKCETKTLVSANNPTSAEERVGTEMKRIPLMNTNEDPYDSDVACQWCGEVLSGVFDGEVELIQCPQCGQLIDGCTPPVKAHNPFRESD